MAATRSNEPEWVFYDGACGLCHRMVLFVLQRDREAARFRFAPLQGETFHRELPQLHGKDLERSVVLRTADERVLMRSEAVMYVLGAFGGPWRLVRGLMALTPSWILDLGYDLVAAIRHRLFRRPEGECPVVPDQFRDRFYS